MANNINESKTGSVIIPKRETLWKFIAHDRMDKAPENIGKH